MSALGTHKVKNTKKEVGSTVYAQKYKAEIQQRAAVPTDKSARRKLGSVVQGLSLAKSRADWHKPATQDPVRHRQPSVRRPRGDTRRPPEQKRENEARRAAEVAGYL